jgi:hypothetical protein
VIDATGTPIPDDRLSIDFMSRARVPHDMSGRRRVRLSERHAMEGGIRCPACGRFNALTDIASTGHCCGQRTEHCDATLALDLVVDP